MDRLPDIECGCGATISSDPFPPNPRGGAPRASGYQSCLRRCERCGIGYSNARTGDAARLTRILRDLFAGLPEWVARGSDAALDGCLNRAHAASKRTEFQSLHSEDHVTWTVFRMLQAGRHLNRVFGLRAPEPALLLWGVPVPDPGIGEALREGVIRVLDRLGENPRFRTEPDVILDAGPWGLILIEAKLFSPNDSLAASAGAWSRYLDGGCFRCPDGIRESGCYELARNWRLGCELAGDRPFTLINLAPAFPPAERTRLARFRMGCRTSLLRRFVLRRWAALLGKVALPDWFPAYAARRGLIL